MHVPLFRVSPRRLLRRLLVGGSVIGLMGGAAACGDLAGLTGTQPFPSGTPNPNVYATAAGALDLYQTTLTAFQYSTAGAGVDSNQVGAFVHYALLSGELTDELQPGNPACESFQCTPDSAQTLDARKLLEGQGNPTDGVYAELQGIRNDAREGIGALTAYDDSAPPALRGHLYALTGYAEVLLADLFCSGIPLSTLNFGADYTYAAGSSTDSVYRDAQRQFQTALTLADSSDSVRIANLARVGLGRAYLARAVYDSAALAVASVPDTYVYSFPVNWALENSAGAEGYGESDTAGRVGLPYVSSGDPRTAAGVVNTNQFGVVNYWPIAYGGSSPGIFPVHVADGVEARLIQAEAALQVQQYPQWLAYLNRARAQAAASLPPLSDPGASPNDSLRVALLFQERAYDLFLTGHRQGDLRRMLRQYKTIYKIQTQVYPSGPYPVPSVGFYQSAVTAPIPLSESVNPDFHGCLTRGA